MLIIIPHKLTAYDFDRQFFIPHSYQDVYKILMSCVL